MQDAATRYEQAKMCDNHLSEGQFAKLSGSTLRMDRSKTATSPQMIIGCAPSSPIATSWLPRNTVV